FNAGGRPTVEKGETYLSRLFMSFARILACWSALLLTTAALPAQPPAPAPATALAQADANDRQTVNGVSLWIQHAHLKQHPIDAEISRRMHKLFIEGWDPKKLFFLDSDI